jgi:protein SCO1
VPGEAPKRRSIFLRYPFLWAFVLGALMLTLLRPCLRRVPPPPAVEGALPAIVLVDAEGKRLDPAVLAGSVWVIAFEPRPCDGACTERRAHMKELQDALRDFHIGGIRLLTAVAGDDAGEDLRATGRGAGADPSLWRFARIAPADLEALGGTPRLGRLLLVDAGGGLRGWYDGGMDGFNEVYNRAQTVRR